MIKELDSVVLAVDLPAHRLKAGDVGTIMHVNCSRTSPPGLIEFPGA